MTPLGLWPFALEAYGRPGVEPILLELQDAHGQCVAFLLWGLWMAASGRTAAPSTLEDAVRLARGWQAAAVTPLRDLRRSLKAPSAAAPGRAWEALRIKVKGLELEAERMLLEMLEAASPPSGTAAGDPLTGLTLAARAWGEAPPPNRLRDLIAAAF